ncbi:MAG: histidinol-phosphate transaminase [Candidatus Omnitrophica bacterium]|nr:histidinol-phosphate transaminase [Candidatus Omnitrophota bacterium]
MKSIANKNIFKVTPYPPGKPIDEVKRSLGLEKVFKLASNENPYPPSPKVLAQIAKESKMLNRYPDGSCFYLRQVLAKRFKVSQKQLIFGNGSDEIIIMAARAFAGRGDEVIVAQPTFLMYQIASRISGAIIKAVAQKNHRYDLKAIKKAVTPKTKIIFIANPDNPTGTYVTKKEVEMFLKGLRKDILVFFDEAYFEFVEKKDYPDTLNLLKQYKNIIVTRTFSKFYSLAGLRIGYGVASEELIDILNRVREPFNVNSIAQTAALTALEDKKYYTDVFKIIKKEKRYLCQQITKMGLTFVKSETNFILINVKSDSTKIFQQLLHKGIIVRDMTSWGLAGFIRVTVGRTNENKYFIKALKEIL